MSTKLLNLWCPGPESNRYVLLGTRDFKSRASASFATRARCIPCDTLLLKRLTRRQSFADDSLIPLFEVVNTDFATPNAAQAFVRLCSRGVAVLTPTSSSNDTGVHMSGQRYEAI